MTRKREVIFGMLQTFADVLLRVGIRFDTIVVGTEEGDYTITCVRTRKEPPEKEPEVTEEERAAAAALAKELMGKLKEGSR